MDLSTPRTLLVTGGAGFIGSALVRHLIAEAPHTVVNADKLTYAGHRASLAPISGAVRHHFEQIDICDAEAVACLFQQYEPDAVLHLAAESHVDRSIDGPAAFVQTNVTGTYTLLEAARRYLEARPEEERRAFRFLHVSTDEVYGSLGATGLFTEETPYDPSSPYSASKAAADHLARAWQRTYGLPVLVTNCSNNYGPYQFPEKLIPLMTLKAAAGEPLPVYGDGQHVRDWLYVEDHVAALLAVLARGTPGETYNVGGRAEKTNLEVVRSICAVLDEVAPHPDVPDRTALITFVEDRPGHDRRYAIDAGKIERALGWAPQESFESGLRKTVQWYLQHTDWCAAVSENSYDLGRLGVGA